MEGKDNMDEYAGECSVLISHVEIQLLWYLIWPNDIIKKLSASATFWQYIYLCSSYVWKVSSCFLGTPVIA